MPLIKPCCQLFEFYEKEMNLLKDILIHVQQDVDSLKMNQANATEQLLRQQIQMLSRVIEGLCRTKSVE